ARVGSKPQLVALDGVPTHCRGGRSAVAGANALHDDLYVARGRRATSEHFVMRRRREHQLAAGRANLGTQAVAAVRRDTIARIAELEGDWHLPPVGRDRLL